MAAQYSRNDHLDEVSVHMTLEVLLVNMRVGSPGARGRSLWIQGKDGVGATGCGYLAAVPGVRDDRQPPAA